MYQRYIRPNPTRTDFLRTTVGKQVNMHESEPHRRQLAFPTRTDFGPLRAAACQAFPGRARRSGEIGGENSPSRQRRARDAKGISQELSVPGLVPKRALGANFGMADCPPQRVRGCE